MTDNEIIKALEYCKDCSANLNVEIIDLITRQQREIENLYEKALEKQMPEAPILDIIYPSRIKSYNCPVCGKGCLVRTDSYCPKYCSNCGQALDWSDTE